MNLDYVCRLSDKCKLNDLFYNFNFVTSRQRDHTHSTICTKLFTYGKVKGSNITGLKKGRDGWRQVLSVEWDACYMLWVCSWLICLLSWTISYSCSLTLVCKPWITCKEKRDIGITDQTSPMCNTLLLIFTVSRWHQIKHVAESDTDQTIIAKRCY